MSNFVIDDGHNKIAGYSAAETDAAIDAAASNLSNLADAYDATATYAVGDYCIHDNQLYKCNAAITTAEAWNANHWTATTMADEIANKQDKITDSGWVNLPLETGYGYESWAPVSYRKIGDFVYLRGLLKPTSSWTANTKIGTLPSGYRPFGNIQFACTYNGISTVAGFLLKSDGSVNTMTGVSGSADIDLSGIRFIADN